MTLHLSERGVHYETFLDGSFSVFLPVTAETWRTWSERAQRVRREASAAYNEALDGSIPIKSTLRKEPLYLARQYAGNIFEPLVNILVDTEKEWVEAREGAFAACGYATIDTAQGKPFRHPESLAGERGGLRKDTVKPTDDPLRNLAARFNGTLRTGEDIMVSTSTSRRPAGVRRAT